MNHATHQTDREILGYSRYVTLVAALFAIFIISPFEYAWRSMSDDIGTIYGWSRGQIVLLLTPINIFQSVGTLLSGMLRDNYRQRWTTTIAGLFSGLGILFVAVGSSYPLVLVPWCVGSFFTGFIDNNAFSTGNKWFSEHRGPMTERIAGAFSWGSLPFIFSVRVILASSPPEVFFKVIDIIAAGLIIIPLQYGLSVWEKDSGRRTAGMAPEGAR